tara:strand:+ start:2683 stop:3258 length:576 start_codon:yes stop_codon:yes gene_type:complete
MKIFFYGGTFDPPHKGHESIVNYLLPLCDKFILFPTFISPLKDVLPKADIYHRINMLKILFNNKKIEIDNFETDKNKKNYTYLTVSYLKNKYNNSSITMVVGSDQLINLNNWKNYKLIIDNVNIICFNRKHKSTLKVNTLINSKLDFIDNFSVDISSTEIRDKLNNKKYDFKSDKLNLEIVKYIKENNLYV